MVGSKLDSTDRTDILKRMPALSPSDQEGERGGGSHTDGDPERGQGGRLSTRGRARADQGGSEAEAARTHPGSSHSLDVANH